MMLDFIVPHYNEPWETGKAFFEMLAMQKGVDFEQIRVLLIHDGTVAFSDDLFKPFPYEVVQYCVPHKGVSAARNFGMDKAEAKWVCFCDFDDHYSDVYALKMVLDLLGTDDFDLLWNPIWMEDFNNGSLRIYPLTRFNMIFVHNKYMRLDFLRANELRFNEELSYSEDSSFLAVMNILLEQRRIGEIKTPCPLYTWAYRKGSCTTDEGNRKRNIEHLFNANRWIALQFERLNYKDAPLMKFRAICDAYFCLHSEDCPQTDLEKTVADYWKVSKDEIEACSPNDLTDVMMASKRNSRTNVKEPKIMNWLKGLEKKYS